MPSFINMVLFMFNISFFEILLVVFVAIVLLGPKDAVKNLKLLKSFVMNLHNTYRKYMNYLMKAMEENDHDNS
jgi:Sec-independent protein translocase protein TatA